MSNYSIWKRIPFVGGPRDGKSLVYKGANPDGMHRTPEMLLRPCDNRPGHFHQYSLQVLARKQPATDPKDLMPRYMYQGILQKEEV